MRGEQIETIMLRHIGAHPGCITGDIAAAVLDEHPLHRFCLVQARNYLRKLEADGLIVFERKNGGSEKHFTLGTKPIPTMGVSVGELPPVPKMDLITRWGCVA